MLQIEGAITEHRGHHSVVSNMNFKIFHEDISTGQDAPCKLRDSAEIPRACRPKLDAARKRENAVVSTAFWIVGNQRRAISTWRQIGNYVSHDRRNAKLIQEAMQASMMQKGRVYFRRWRRHCFRERKRSQTCDRNLDKGTTVVIAAPANSVPPHRAHLREQPPSPITKGHRMQGSLSGHKHRKLKPADQENCSRTVQKREGGRGPLNTTRRGRAAQDRSIVHSKPDAGQIGKGHTAHGNALRESHITNNLPGDITNSLPSSPVHYCDGQQNQFICGKRLSRAASPAKGTSQVRDSELSHRKGLSPSFADGNGVPRLRECSRSGRG